jgi:hypothetical protein
MTTVLRRAVLGIGVGLAVCLSISQTHAAVQITAIDLGTFGGSLSYSRTFTVVAGPIRHRQAVSPR